MITGKVLEIYQQRLLLVLDANKGREVRDQQAVTDFQITVDPSARPDDVRAAMDGLVGQKLAAKRHEPLRGWLWSITSEGKAEAAKLAYEEL